MNGCEGSPVLPDSMLKAHFPELMDLFRKMVCINYAQVNKNISYCPGSVESCDIFCQVMDGVHITTV